MNFTHEANPVRVNARVVVNQRSFNPPSFTLDDGTVYVADAGMLARYVPASGDYLVTQEDGYEYFNPKDVFERKYRSL